MRESRRSIWSRHVAIVVSALCLLSAPALALPPSNLSYTPDSLMYSDAGPSPAPPSVTGVVTRWTVHPSLPDNMKLDTLTGVISGWPNALFSWTPYTITAINDDGRDSTILYIANAGGLSIDGALRRSSEFRVLSSGQVTFTLAAPAHVTLTARTLAGRQAAVLLDERMPAGAHTREVNTAPLSPGLYLFHLRTGAAAEARVVARMVAVTR